MMGAATWMLWASVIMLLLVALAIAAVVSVARHPRLESTAKAVWIVLVVLAPVLGPIAWFIYRFAEREQPVAGS